MVIVILIVVKRIAVDDVVMERMGLWLWLWVVSVSMVVKGGSMVFEGRA